MVSSTEKNYYAEKLDTGFFVMKRGKIRPVWVSGPFATKLKAEKRAKEFNK